MKRLLDIAFVLLTAGLWLPLLALTALAVWLCDGRPLFFLQRRAGRGGKPFSVYKFKTMVASPGGEPVATPLGKWLRKLSLDEVPQLVNVLKGDMSLVGPRPLPTRYLPRYTPEQMRRHEVLPGITGWAQIHGRNALEWESRFAHDVWYVDHRSLWLDAKILFLTVATVFTARGIAEEGEATMSSFKGERQGTD